MFMVRGGRWQEELSFYLASVWRCIIAEAMHFLVVLIWSRSSLLEDALEFVVHYMCIAGSSLVLPHEIVMMLVDEKPMTTISTSFSWLPSINFHSSPSFRLRLFLIDS
jgi:hypothetical protein